MKQLLHTSTSFIREDFYYFTALFAMIPGIIISFLFDDPSFVLLGICIGIIAFVTQFLLSKHKANSFK